VLDVTAVAHSSHRDGSGKPAWWDEGLTAVFGVTDPALAAPLRFDSSPGQCMGVVYPPKLSAIPFERPPQYQVTSSYVTVYSGLPSHGKTVTVSSPGAFGSSAT
jgi:hypothetical protein